MTARVLLAVCFLFLMLAGCDNEKNDAAVSMVGGNPTRGRAHIVSYGCISCHTIPGIHGANAVVGPPLSRMGVRSYVGGVLQNTPDNMVHWIENPPAIDPKAAMPNLHVTESDARDIATYLYTLQ